MGIITNLIAVSLVNLSPSIPAPRESGLDLVAKVRANFYLPSSKLYAESYEIGKPAGEVAFNWGVGVWLSALVSAAQADPKLKPVVAEYATAARSYWNDKGPVPGYDVLPGPKSVDRYYDDNAWMVMALVESFELTKDREYYADAERTMKYVLSGLDDKLGGGIYWRESDRGASKNTCSNAPSSAALLALYAHSKDKTQLKLAKDIYSWTYKTLRDPADGIMWDNIEANGKIGTYKWTYNTALMIRSALDLYRFTKDDSFKKQAVEFTKASRKHWLNSATGEMKCEGKFAHLLLESWQLAAHRLPELKTEMLPAIALVKNHLATAAANSDGWYLSRWDAKPKPLAKVELIDQASVARALLYRP